MSRSDSQGEQLSQLQTLPSTMTDSSSALGDESQLNENTEFSEALVGIDGERRGIDVSALERETQVIDFDATEQSLEDLPGPTKVSSDITDDDLDRLLNPNSSRQRDVGRSERDRSVPAQTDGGVTEGDAE